MRILDFYPYNGFFKPEEKLQFSVKTDKKSGEFDGGIEVFRFNEKVMSHSFTSKKIEQNGGTSIFVTSEPLTYGGYIAKLTVGSNVCFTAFDILNCWTDFPRYGYVSDFTPDKTDVEAQIEAMAKYHVNGVQFYDWQYRHDALLSDTKLYLDPFDREMSLDTVHIWITACHDHGMSAMPYLAIYAASVDFWSKHKEWGMFDENGEPLMFEDFLGLVDPTYATDWFKHLDAECDKVLNKTDFDGLHIDQYGEPKIAFDKDGKSIDIPKAFVDFIDHQKNKDKGTIVFNAVGNWPTEQIAKSKADFMYIEVWDFTPTFKDLMDIVSKAREKSGWRPVVIPIYIKAKDFNNVLLADAVISACGGTHLELGDGEKLLSDPYFPKAENTTTQQRYRLRKYWDFIVGYQNVIGPRADNAQMNVNVQKDIMTICRQSGKYRAINLINCKYDDKWTDSIAQQTQLANIDIRIECEAEIKSVLAATPDEEDITLKPLQYEVREGVIITTLPSLNYWSMILIEEK